MWSLFGTAFALLGFPFLVVFVVTTAYRLYEPTLMSKRARQNRRTLSYKVPPIGELVHHDFRSNGTHSSKSRKETIRVVTWNIEFGHSLPHILRHLRSLDADIILLQECDIGTHRNNYIDVAAEIAAELKMQMLFVNQANVPSRSPQHPDGAHGDAILTHFPIEKQWTLDLGHMPSGWKGKRALPCARVLTPQGPLDVRSVHLIAHSGIKRRQQQLTEVFKDVTQRSRPQDGSALIPCILGGDMNTVAHGVKRFAPHFCNDEYRWKSLGYTEAQWWYHKILPGTGFLDPSYERPTYQLLGGWFMRAKLDWMLLSSELYCSNTDLILISGDDASDHNYVCMDIARRI